MLPIGRFFPGLAIICQVGAGEQQALAGACYGLIENSSLVAAQARFERDAARLQRLALGFAQEGVFLLGAWEFALR